MPKKGQMKYDIIIKPGGNPEDVSFEYVGVDGINLENGKLIISTPFGDITESIPESYQPSGRMIGTVINTIRIPHYRRMTYSAAMLSMTTK
jgi:hypothetical protein